MIATLSRIVLRQFHYRIVGRAAGTRQWLHDSHSNYVVSDFPFNPIHDNKDPHLYVCRSISKANLRCLPLGMTIARVNCAHRMLLGKMPKDAKGSIHLS